MHTGVEPLSDHPLFLALLLMGGALALGCGGIAQYESPGGAQDSAKGGAAAGANHGGGSGTVLDPPTQTTGGSASASTLYNPACPYAQWDCSMLSIGNLCYFNLQSKDDPKAAGCTCDSTRPKSAAACNADEVFVCRQAFPPYPPFATTLPTRPPTWDGNLHVECECVSAPPPTENNCGGICVDTYGGVGISECRLPGTSTCDEHGTCTVTAADVLRQDGVLCGCADIGHK